MGCFKKIINLIIFLAILFCFFAYGGYTFVKNKYDDYTRPPREVFVEEEKDFGDLEGVSSDYALSRSLNFFGLRKLNALYLPKNQKITVIDLNSNEILSEEDFSNGKLEEKFEAFSNKVMNFSIVPIQNVEIKKTGNIKTGSRTVPYAEFEAEVKMVPFFKVKGTIAAYKTKNRENVVTKIKDKIQNKDNTTTKLVISCKFPNGYESKPVKNLVSQIKL